MSFVARFYFTINCKTVNLEFSFLKGNLWVGHDVLSAMTHARSNDGSFTVYKGAGLGYMKRPLVQSVLTDDYVLRGKVKEMECGQYIHGRFVV